MDKELERRGHCYVRYADDVKVFVKSEAAAERTQSGIIRFIEDTLLLKVNRAKTRICKAYELNFLGHSILRNGQLGLSRISEERLKQKVQMITRRNRGVSFGQILADLRKYLPGWLIYFRYAHMGKKLVRLDSWVRRKLRCYRLKQCKRVIGMVRWLRRLGVEDTLSWRTALSGKSWWRLSNSPAVNMGLGNHTLRDLGYYSLYDNYTALHRKLL